MESPPRFKSTQDWNNFISKFQTLPPEEQLSGSDLYEIRKTVYSDIEKIRGRPLIVYATKFLETPPGTPNLIDISDVDGFTDMVNSYKSKNAIDILLHSPGGRPDATERIVTILRNNFKEVHFLIPHSAYSAATMLALSGNSIVLHPSATLGPIDPQINGTPARSIKRGFEKVRDLITKEGPESLPAYIPLIEKYTLDLLELCEDSEKLSQELVTNWLQDYMFQGKGDEEKINAAVVFFSDYDRHLIHSRPIFYDKIKDFNLNISIADNKLAELMWEVYVLLNGFFNASQFVKLYENKVGVSWGKQMNIIVQSPPQTQKKK